MDRFTSMPQVSLNGRREGECRGMDRRQLLVAAAEERRQSVRRQGERRKLRGAGMLALDQSRLR